MLPSDSTAMHERHTLIPRGLGYQASRKTNHLPPSLHRVGTLSRRR